MCFILQIELIWTSVTELHIIIPYNIQTDNKSNSQYSTYIIHDIFFAYWSYVIIIFLPIVLSGLVKRPRSILRLANCFCRCTLFYNNSATILLENDWDGENLELCCCRFQTKIDQNSRWTFMSRDSSLLNLLLKMGKESHNNRKTKGM